MKRKNEPLTPSLGIIRVGILVVGLAIAHLGVTLFLLANLGADPFNVLVQGIYKTITKAVDSSLITHGRVHMCMCFLIILILLIVDKSYIKIGTLICMFLGGPIIDFYNLFLEPLFADGMEMWTKILFNVLGCIILAYGMTIVIKSEAGTGPNDLVAVVIADKTKKKFGIIRVVVDLVFALSGFLLGGTIGIGTVICAAVVGPVAGLFMPINERIIRRILQK